MLGYRFSIDFEIHTLEYDFLFGNHKHFSKVSRLLVPRFFLEIFKIQMQGYGFSCKDFW
jgi:hypothetical protein